MDALQKALIVAILQESLDQIAIANRGRHTKYGNLTKASINKRFEEKVNDSVYQELDPFKVAASTLNDIKLQNDIHFLEVVFCKTLYELLVSNTWHFVQKVASAEEKNYEEEKKLVSQHRCNLISLEGSKKRLGKKLTKLDVRLRLVDEMFAELKEDMKNINQINNLELSLVQRWEKTRFDQIALLHQQDEKQLLNDRKVCSYKHANEQRLIHDIETYNHIQIKDYEAQIEYWQQKYNVELKTLDEKIKHISTAILQICKKFERCRDISATRQQFIDEYKAQKDKERREFEIEQNRIYSAIKIQAWWRGVMVRKHLGPYRRKKKGKKGGKKGNQ